MRARLCAICLVAACAAAALLAAAAPASAQAGFQTLYDGWAYSGIPVHVSGCTVTATVGNISTAAHIVVSQIGSDDVTFTLDPGNSADVGSFRIEVANNGVDHAGNRAYLRILQWQGGTSPSSGPQLSCGVPGQRALGGDRVTFPITIQNPDAEGHTYTLSASSDTGWALSFATAGKDVYKLSVPGQQSVTVDLVVQTTVGAGIGEKRVTARVDSAALDLYVYITRVNQTADVTFALTSKIASIGDKITYSLTVHNLQAKENTYRLSASGLPDNWYYRYKEDAASAEEIAETVVPAGGEKSLVLEVLPPSSVSAGDYSFIATVAMPEGAAIDTGLSLKLKSSADMTMVSSKLGYDAKPGEPFEIVVYVKNSGNGPALTNVYLDTQAPDGWTVQVTPNRTASLTSGATATFRAKVTPPGNIAASDYDITIKAKSDQMEREKDYRITVHVDSYIQYVAVGIIVLVLVGVVLVYRKYGRR